MLTAAVSAIEGVNALVHVVSMVGDVNVTAGGLLQVPLWLRRV